MRLRLDHLIIRTAEPGRTLAELARRAGAPVLAEVEELVGSIESGIARAGPVDLEVLKIGAIPPERPLGYGLGFVADVPLMEAVGELRALGFPVSPPAPGVAGDRRWHAAQIHGLLPNPFPVPVSTRRPGVRDRVAGPVAGVELGAAGDRAAWERLPLGDEVPVTVRDDGPAGITRVLLTGARRKPFSLGAVRFEWVSAQRAATLPPVSAVDVLLLVCAGVGAGLTGSIAGLASLISYPALLAVGLGPIAANVTNTTALVFSTLGSTLGSRPELEGQAARLRPLAIAGVLGGATGATLLLLTSSDTFERIAPWLIGVASLTILVRPRVHPEHRHPGTGPGLTAGVFAIAIYGGYFGAAAGVMVLALMLVATGESLARSNAFKNVVLGVANATAAVAFALLGHVHWDAAAPLALGLFAGGRLGPIVVRRSNATVLRTLIGLAGLALAVKLAFDAYG